MNPSLFRVAATDSVATALDDLAAGTVASVGDSEVILNEAVGRGHKVALRAIAPGEPVLKFGFPIGRATRQIAPGDRVHTHNVSTALEASADYAWQPHKEVASDAMPRAGFAGYRRAEIGDMAGQIADTPFGIEQAGLFLAHRAVTQQFHQM